MARTTNRSGSVLGGLTLAGGAALAYASLIERNAYTVRRHTIPVLPRGATPFRVLHLSDLHLAPWQQMRIDWLRSLGALRPDLVVLTGDLLGHREAIPAVGEALAPLAGIPGVSVHGSNDYFGPVLKNPLRYIMPSLNREHVFGDDLDTAALDALLDGYGWTNLDNTAAVVEVGDQAITFLGTDDAHLHRDDLDVLPEALNALREGHGQLPPLRFGVTHAPYRRVLNTLTDLGASLIFAGHTHGGQVRIPFVQSAPATNCDIPGDQARGVSHWHHGGRSAWLNVSAGVGTAITAPVRFACRPEVSLLSLVPGR